MSEEELRIALEKIVEIKAKHNEPEVDIEYRNGTVYVTYEYETSFFDNLF